MKEKSGYDVLGKRLTTIWEGKKTFKGNNLIIEIDAELRNSNSYDWENPDNKLAITELAISGSIWKGKEKRDRNNISAGQCYDSILPSDFREEAEITAILKLWKAWHLNGLMPGSKAQEDALRLFYKINPDVESSYDKSVEYLKTINLHDDHGYVYGTKWLGRELPEQVIKEIKQLIPGRNV